MYLKNYIHVKVFDVDYKDPKASKQLTQNINHYLKKIENIDAYKIDIKMNPIATSDNPNYGNLYKQVVIITLTTRW